MRKVLSCNADCIFSDAAYLDGSHELVWLMDPSITYLKGKHIPLFVVGLLISLLGTAYSLLLFSCRWVLQWSNIRQNRVMTLLDAPFTPNLLAWLAAFSATSIVYRICCKSTWEPPCQSCINYNYTCVSSYIESDVVWKDLHDKACRHSGNMLYRQPSSLFQFYLLCY